MGIFARDKHQGLNTLACIVMGLRGWRTLVELHNDAYVSGKIIDADVTMNMEMEKAKYTDGNGKSIWLDLFHVRGRKVRYIHIPDQVDVMKLIENQVAPAIKGRKVTKKGHIAQKRTQQTLQRYHRQKEQEKMIPTVDSSQVKPSNN